MGEIPDFPTLVKLAFLLIVGDKNNHFEELGISITEATLNVERPFAAIRVIGPGFQRGTVIKISTPPEWKSEFRDRKLAIEWADLNLREFLTPQEILVDNGPGSDLVLRIACGLGSKDYRRQFI